MFPAREALYTPARLGVGRSRPILLFALVMVGIVLGPSIASAQLLNLSWIDNSGCQASFIIQRGTSTSGPYSQIAQLPVGVVTYRDTAVSFGTTYCDQVAAVSAATTVAASFSKGGKK